jgi:prepilin-type N-terminal cleavage/methylation domain-containing protein
MQTSRAGILIVDRATKAFTLIEVLAALAIASIGLLGLLRLNLVGLATARAAAAQTAAVFLAQEKNAEAAAVGFPPLGSHSGSVEREGISFDWTTNVTEARVQLTGGRPLPGLRQIQTTISWPQGTGRKDVQMTTYAAESRFVE